MVTRWRAVDSAPSVATLRPHSAHSPPTMVLWVHSLTVATTAGSAAAFRASPSATTRFSNLPSAGARIWPTTRGGADCDDENAEEEEDDDDEEKEFEEREEEGKEEREEGEEGDGSVVSHVASKSYLLNSAPSSTRHRTIPPAVADIIDRLSPAIEAFGPSATRGRFLFFLAAMTAKPCFGGFAAP